MGKWLPNLENWTEVDENERAQALPFRHFVNSVWKGDKFGLNGIETGVQ